MKRTWELSREKTADRVAGAVNCMARAITEPLADERTEGERTEEHRLARS
jgi:hypothetical protein